MISKFEIDYLKNNGFSENNLIYVSPKFESLNFSYDAYLREDIIFISSNHEPNVEGIQYFIDK